MAGAGVLGAWLYARVVRPWHLRWGATDAEADRSMPGDDLVALAEIQATRAITIAAPPERVWPWIVQMGTGRAGFYALDRIDNQGAPSATRLVPELQHLAVGDVMPTDPSGEGFTVVAVDEPRSMVLHIAVDPTRPVRMTVSCAMTLEPIDQAATRLVCRLRASFGRNLLSRLYRVLFGPGDFIMMRLMLRGIGQRAEAGGTSP
ncbi:MAG: hypothetical protein IPM45_15815 [Acidimicrobiales bacterium]|nr:hypothetical protein [Acidimicrobiales bacterium]